MKKLNLRLCQPFISVLLVSALWSCDSEPKAVESNGGAHQSAHQSAEQLTGSPQEVAKNYLDAFILRRDLEAAYRFASKADQRAKSKEAFITEITSPGWEDLFKAVNSYTITQSKIGSKQAAFTVSIQTPDLARIFKDVLKDQTVLDSATANRDQGHTLALEKLQKYQDGSVPCPTLSITHDLNLIQEAGLWKVNFKWKEVERLKQLEHEKNNPVINPGANGVLMTDAQKGNVDITVNAVSYKTFAQAKPGMILCIVNVTVTNHMPEQPTQAFSLPLNTAKIHAEGGGVFARYFISAPNLGIENISGVEPLLPGKSVRGDLVFQVNPDAKQLMLVLNTGFSPLPNQLEIADDHSLGIKLGGVKLPVGADAD